MKRLHALRKLSYVADAENNWTLCQRHVADRKQIVAFDDAVTCKNCLSILRFRKEEAAQWNSREHR